jgi:hypothetical protein
MDRFSWCKKVAIFEKESEEQLLVRVIWGGGWREKREDEVDEDALFGEGDEICSLKKKKSLLKRGGSSVKESRGGDTLKRQPWLTNKMR